jgi:hypothetical protein
MAQNPTPALNHEIEIGTMMDGTGRPLTIDINELVASRGYIEANSGGGKSYTVRAVIEQSHHLIQQFVLDVEDEFASLREKYDFLLVNGQGSDVQIAPEAAGLFARRLLETGASAVINLFELSEGDPDEPETNMRAVFVRNFLSAMIDAPQALWHPVMVIVDEAHKFAPEGRRSVSKKAVIDLMSLGRKRPFCGILATQRPTKISKDAIGEANNILIGRAARPIDIKEAAKELGFDAKEAAEIKYLKPGEFWATGPAFNIEGVVKVKIRRVETTHRSPGQVAGPRPPAKGEVRALITEFVDISKAAEVEVKDLEAAKARIAVLEAQLAGADVVPAVGAGELDGLYATIERQKKEIDRLDRERVEIANKVSAAARSTAFHEVAEFCSDKLGVPRLTQISHQQTVEQVEREVEAFSALTRERHAASADHFIAADVMAPRKNPPKGSTPFTRPAKTDGVKIPGLKAGAVEMLRILCLIGKPTPRKVLASLAGISPTSGTGSDYVALMKRANVIVEDDDGVAATDHGRRAFDKVTLGKLPTAAEYISRHKIKAGARLMVEHLRECGEATRKELCAAAKISPSSGTSSDYVAALKRAGLVDEPDKVRLSLAWKFVRKG